MTMLRDHTWKIRYTTDEHDIISDLYVPALKDAVRYDHGTGYFDAGSLSLTMRGIEGLIRNDGKMRLLVGCSLSTEEITAIQKGEEMKHMVEKNLLSVPLDPPDSDTAKSLEILSWMIATDHLSVKVAVMCDERRRPVGGTAIYHKKIGTVRDASGDGIAWSGSGNFTVQGMAANSESLSVFTSWLDRIRQQDVESEFEKDWSGKNSRLIVMDIPEAIRQRLLQYAPPKGQLPAKLKKITDTQREDIWRFISWAHQIKDTGKMVGLATAPVKPWPHQTQVFLRLHSSHPTRLLIADEVGLGKTIQAGLFLRQAWLEGKRQILVMVPAGLRKQWQTELHEKLNLDWPIYDGKSLIWQDTHAKGDDRKASADDSWTTCGPVIVSSQLARRDEHADIIAAAEWDIVILDEAHYARQKEPNNPKKHTPNKMLKLMRRLQSRTNDLILLTATPMQLHPVELYDLLKLLGMPDEWTWDNFERYYKCVRNLDKEDIKFVSTMFQAAVRVYGPIDQDRLNVHKLRSKKILDILEGRRTMRLLSSDYDTIRKALLLGSPVTRLVSRNTRIQLREYIKKNNLNWKLGVRDVCDKSIKMSPDERETYELIEEYISQIWNKYKGNNRQAIGFVLTIYRKRLASSFAALKKTLENHLKRIDGDVSSSKLYEDEYDDMDSEEIIDREEKALKDMDREAVCELLHMIRDLPSDTKFNDMIDVIAEIRRRKYRKVIIFTQFTDTMDFLRENLRKRGHKILCYSGRGGERPDINGVWQRIKSREETKKEFQAGSMEIMICTDAAAEGLNFQFCGAMINYDMPWNPMRVEQRIGRIDRIGQEYSTIRIINMFYEDTVETDVYRALQDRIGKFKGIVGPLQPILSRLEGIIRDMALEHPKLPRDLSHIDAEFNKHTDGLDDMLATDIDTYKQPESPVTMHDINRILSNESIMRPYDVKRLHKQQYDIKSSDGKRIRITTSQTQFEMHSNSMEFWSPGSPVFPVVSPTHDKPKYHTLKQLLDSLELHG